MPDTKIRLNPFYSQKLATEINSYETNAKQTNKSGVDIAR